MTRHATAGAMGVSLAHQISQPLSNVAMYLHVARQLLAEKPEAPPPVAGALLKATEQLRRAKDILERLRDFVSRGTLRRAPVDLGALTRKVVALAEDDARAHGVSVRLEAASVPPLSRPAARGSARPPATMRAGSWCRRSAAIHRRRPVGSMSTTRFSQSTNSGFAPIDSTTGSSSTAPAIGSRCWSRAANS